jgi:hypothetical protein
MRHEGEAVLGSENLFVEMLLIDFVLRAKRNFIAGFLFEEEEEENVRCKGRAGLAEGSDGRFEASDSFGFHFVEVVAERFGEFRKFAQ